MIVVDTSMNDWKLLQLVLTYRMTKLESKAWRVAILYIRLASEYFPTYKHYRVGKGDPRTSLLFRYCYKLVREYGDKISSKEYRYYIRAQFDVLKNILRQDSAHALISPNCLVGESAWRRWMLWKRKLDRQIADPRSEKVVLARPDEVKNALDHAKVFLVKKLGELTRDKIKLALESRAMIRWVAIGEVSPFYLIMSPLVEEYVKEFAVDYKLYLSSITKECREYFKVLFPFEV